MTATVEELREEIIDLNAKLLVDQVVLEGKMYILSRMLKEGEECSP